MSIDVISVVISVVTLLFVVVGWRLSWRAYVYPFRADALADLYEMAFALEGELDIYHDLSPDVAFCKFAGISNQSKDISVSTDMIKREMRRVRILMFKIQWLWNVVDANSVLDYLNTYQYWLRAFRIGYFGFSDEHPDPHRDLERRLCAELIRRHDDLANSLPVLEDSIKYRRF